MTGPLQSFWRFGGGLPPAPDFLRPARGVHRLAWWALAAALAALSASGLDAQAQWQLRAAALERLDAAHARAARLVADRAAAGQRAAVATTAAARSTTPSAAALLGQPWREVFDSVERATPDGLRWWSFEYGSDGLLRLEGQVVNAATAAAVAAQFQRMPGWHEVSLRQIERDTGAGTDLRFQLTAHRTPALTPKPTPTPTPTPARRT